LAYHELLAICVEAIKELDQKASLAGELQSKVEKMNQIINELETKIAIINQSSIIEKTTNASSYSDGTSYNEIKLFQNRPNPYTIQTVITCLIPQVVKSASLIARKKRSSRRSRRTAQRCMRK
jgi:hypothetical protein